MITDVADIVRCPNPTSGPHTRFGFRVSLSDVQVKRKGSYSMILYKKKSFRSFFSEDFMKGSHNVPLASSQRRVGNVKAIYMSEGSFFDPN